MKAPSVACVCAATRSPATTTPWRSSRRPTSSSSSKSITLSQRIPSSLTSIIPSSYVVTFIMQNSIGLAVHINNVEFFMLFSLLYSISRRIVNKNINLGRFERLRVGLPLPLLPHGLHSRWWAFYLPPYRGQADTRALFVSHFRDISNIQYLLLQTIFSEAFMSGHAKVYEFGKEFKCLKNSIKLSLLIASSITN